MRPKKNTREGGRSKSSDRSQRGRSVEKRITDKDNRGGKKKFSDDSGEKRTNKKRFESGEESERKSYSRGGSSRKEDSRSSDRKTSFKKDSDRKPFRKDGEKSFRKDGEKPFRKDGEKSFRKDGEKPFRKDGEKSFRKDGEKPFRKDSDKSFPEKGKGKKFIVRDDKPFQRKKRDEDDLAPDDYYEKKKRFDRSKKDYEKKTQSRGSKGKSAEKKNDDGTTRLNKFIANTGICSRREADKLIESGVIKVNGKIVTELGTRITASDTVHYHDQLLKREKLVYVLLNKPKDFITTVDDPQKRKTVLDLVKHSTRERIYPVGRLDRNTTGVLLLTNDGEITDKLTHPRNNVKKIYHVMTDQNVKGEDLDKLKEGFELEDGFIKVDDVQFVGSGLSKKDLGVEIHSGRNRIVRRMFEHLGYNVVKLDRVMFAGLTKKDIPRGKWRFLTEKEIQFLRML